MPRDATRKVDQGEARVYIAKAEEFIESARSSLEAARWDAAGLAAIHAGVSAADAAVVSTAGVRSASSDHGAVIKLLEDQVPEFGATQKRQLTGVLRMKNQVEYDTRQLTELEARTLADQAARFVRWARTVVAGHAH